MIPLDTIRIKGLGTGHFKQLLSYLENREAEGWYAGNRAQFEKRHNELKEWLEGIIVYLNKGVEPIPQPATIKDSPF